MGLYDVIDEISAREAAKTETGDSRVFGVMIGLVAANHDPGGTAAGADAMDGRVCVTIPTRGGGDDELKWARVSMPSAGGGWGHYFLPETGDMVLLAFENGSIEKPYVIGCLNRASDKFLKESADKDNRFKRIVTRHGTRIVFEDDAGDDTGQKDKLTLETAGGRLRLLLDNGRELIRLGGGEDESYIELGTARDRAVIKIHAGNRLEIKVGDKITVVMNGETGGVSVKADTLVLQGGSQVSAKSDGALKLEAAQISARADSSMRFESSGSAKFGGSTTSIG